MTAKPKRTSGNKGDLKTTIILILLTLVAVQSYFLFFKGKKQDAVETKVVKTKSQPVQSVKTPVTTVKKPVGTPTKPVVSAPQTTVQTVKKAPLAVPVAPTVPAGSAGKIAIILDDFGYTMRNCKYLKEIDQHMTIAVLPNLRHTNDIQECAKSAGKDIILHLPMEPYNNNDHYPDNYLLTTTMPAAEVNRLLEDTLNKMPLIIGVNNHMGSRATEDKALMRLIYKQIKKRKLFYVDSMTSPHKSVCAEVAADMNIPFGQRDVFLDNVNTREAIKIQVNQLAQKARKKGYAVAIGHDRELTLQVLKEELPLLEQQGFTIVRMKDLVKTK